LESFRQHYEAESRPHFEKDEAAYYYWNTEYYVEVVRREIGENLRKAVRNGNIAVVEHASGLDGDDGMEIDFVEYERLGQLIERPSLLLFIFGDTGSGKSFTSVSLAELWKLRVDGHILTNIRSFAEANDGVVYIDSYPDLIRYAVEHPTVRKLFVADELSSLMSGYAADRHKVEQLMRPLIRKQRKEPFKMSTIGVGHRPGDIHPTLLNGELAYPSWKTDLYTLEVYESMDGTESGEDEIATLSGIKEPGMKVDTEDNGNWSWGTEDEVLDAAYDLKEAGYGDMLELIRQLEDDEEGEDGEDGHEIDEEVIRRQIRAYDLYHDEDMSYREVADEMNMSESTAYEAVQREAERRDDE
jgi:hypothetical protein